MKIQISSVRKFLEENKIFFEVIVASLLSFMAIYVSLQANRIADNQTMIMEQENMPQLEIRKTYEFNEETQFNENDLWYFFNRGGKLSNFDATAFSFFNMIYKYDEIYDTLEMPLYNYFNLGGTLTGESEGLIYSLDNNRMNRRIKDLKDSLDLFVDGYCYINSFVQIIYTDIFDKSHIEYYQINPSINIISSSEWDSLKIRFNSDRYGYPTLSNLNTHDILKFTKENSR